MAVSKFTSGSNANDFNLNIGSTYSSITLTQEYPAGAYSFTSVSNDTTMDIYLYNAQGFVAYTNTKGIIPQSGFNKVVILGGTVGDVLSFSYKTTFSTVASTDEVTAGPVILSTTPLSLPNVNSTTVVTGLNFATNITATFTGTDNQIRAAKSVVRGSVNSLVITRPDVFPIGASPYTLTVTNPSVANQPTGSSSNIISVTAGVGPVWANSASQSGATGFALTSLSALDADSASSVTYSIISGAFPTGTTFNTSTGALTGIPTTAGAYTVTVRASDSGGNFTDRSFTYTITGGVVTSDATYYYQVFTSNATFAPPIPITADILMIAGGGGTGTSLYHNGGAGAGGYLTGTLSLSATSYPIVVGGGGAGGTGSNQPGVNGGNTTGFGATALGGGYGGTYSGTPASSGGSGGGGAENGNSVSWSAGGATQGNSGGLTGYGNSGANGNTITVSHAGGGGGAGAAGQTGVGGGSNNGGRGGHGGAGRNTNASWLTAIAPVMTGVSGWSTATSTGYIAGGGGGAAYQDGASLGGVGGGGRGAGHQDGIGNGAAGFSNGVTNTGSGAGGYERADDRSGATGGSGIVVVRYTRAQVGG
jgi:hypothetical protein